LGMRSVVEARPGGNTRIATEALLKAPADGSTLLLIGLPFATNPILFPSLPYDSLKSFSAVVHLIKMPNAFWVAQDSPLRSMADLIAMAKSKPGAVTVGSGGTGSGGHLAVEMISMLTGASITHVPFKGDAPAIIELLGGRISATINSPTASLANYKAGRLRGIGVAADERSPLLPEVPTLAEQGLKDTQAYSWLGLVAHSGVRREIIAKLNAEANAALAIPEVRERLIATGQMPVGGPPEQFENWIRAEMQRWGDVIRTRGIKID
ncbi:MAG: tripartite tricarboxylate transporter substrate binding protein, partial [Betaproteobacteria bacterium]|nr:tripartite tricarboxylate transporter substrate binding protein [Betaproteobacteria bacterium]